jgi:hypothetical protein
MKKLFLAAFAVIICATLAFAPIAQPSAATTASAQTVVVDQSPECGAMVSGQWTPNGHCHEFATCGVYANDAWTLNSTCSDKHLRLSGVITMVKGTMVSIQQADRTITIDDRPAIKNQTSGRVAVGRSVIVHGYWDTGMFYATRIDTVQVQ